MDSFQEKKGLCVVILKNAYTINEQKKFDDKLFSIIDQMVGEDVKEKEKEQEKEEDK